MNFNQPLILASNSPRRHELLKAVVSDFSVKVREVDESFPTELATAEVAKYIAEKKANAYRDDLDSEILITADTVVINKGKVLGKPKDKDEAFTMLKAMSGGSHKVVTGVCIVSKAKKILFDAVTTVHFNSLSDKEINDYISNYQPFDKAGAYGIQELAADGSNLLDKDELEYLHKNNQMHLVSNPSGRSVLIDGIRKIEGSYFNVVGLPIINLYNQLTNF